MRASISRAIAEEVPIAIELNGMGYAVLMGTGEALEDLACGFALSERLVESAADILDVDAQAVEAGIMLRLTLTPEAAARAELRTRHRTSDSSCGLCGIENLEQAIRPLHAVTATAQANEEAIFAAVDRLHDHQPLNRLTGAVHAAALCDADGAIRLVREDVGRHNAFDKLIGAMLRGGTGWDGGFALLSSRCSYELVEKAVLAGCPMLVTISAPTSLAIERARQAGLPLVVLARPDAVLRL
ncbi:formate dehydrogenase accessory sulfurtransferase FdhD [Sphingomonas chungangi]|uniref:formate dehydrogenase accessory sulfurtransferase FdhD n=1 Tax=Sphingomonas chungangi TaxID=2683589 RepID=UPI0031B5ABB0